MNWFYSKNGQQAGPVAFSEIERLYGAGELTADSLVWQQGMPNWVKLSTVLAAPTAPPLPAGAPALPVEPFSPAASAVPATPLPDYGDFLCWGIIGVLVPCVSFFIYIALIVLNLIEYFAARKGVQEGRLAESEYSKIHPVLFILGFICCGWLLYPLFMHFRNKSGYFKPQPSAVIVAIIVAILILIGGGFYGYENADIIQAAAASYQR